MIGTALLLACASVFAAPSGGKAAPKPAAPAGVSFGLPWRCADLKSGQWLDHWVVIGPFPAFTSTPPGEGKVREDGWRAAFDRDWLVSVGGERSRGIPVALTVTADGRAWGWGTFYAEDGGVNLNDVFGRTDHVVAYALAEIVSPGRARWWMKLWSDDAVKVFVNGRPVHDNFVMRKYSGPGDWVKVDLEPGTNQVLVKVLNGTQDWIFSTQWMQPVAALAVAASQGSTSAVASLMAGGCSATLTGAQDMTPLHVAAHWGRTETARQLIDAGANVNAASKAGVRPLHVAERGGRDAMVEALIGAGARRTPAPAGPAQSGERLAEWRSGTDPGAAVAVIRDGRVVYRACVGFARLETREPITPRTRFLLGSISKQFVAMGILLLDKTGRLRIEDPIRRIIPELPDRFDRITVRQLMRHTSGLPAELADGDEQEKVYSSWPRLLAGLAAATVYEEPGTRYLYSSLGYVLLGVALERASGKPVQEYLDGAVFRPAGMHDTRVDDPTRDDPALALSYLRVARGWQRSTHPEGIRRAAVVRNIGAVASTLDDLVKWDRVWREPVLLDLETLKDAFKPGLLKTGWTAAQGWGWILGQGRRARQLWHGGSWINFNSIIWRHLDYPVTIICLTNSRPGEEWDLADDLAEIWIGRKTWLQE